MGDIIGYDDSGSPIYRANYDDMGNLIAPNITKKDTGKRFDDAIKDLYWDVLGREPDEAGLEFYRKQFGRQISPEEEQQFYRTAEKELQERGEGAGDPLYNLYTQNLGRAPSLEEYRKARTQFGGDVTGEEEQQFFEQEVLPGLRQSQDPIFKLYQEELGRNPDVGGYRFYQEQFGQPTYITDQMRQQFLAGGGYGGSREIPDQMAGAFRELMGRDPTDREKQELSSRVGTLNQDQLGNYLAQQNLSERPRYATSATSMFGAYDPLEQMSNQLLRYAYQDPFTQAFTPPIQYQSPRISQTMQMAGQQFYQTPTSTGPLYRDLPKSISVGPDQYHVANLAGQYQTPTTTGVNYIGAPTNIAPITQGFQPVGMPSTIGGKGGYQRQQAYQPMGGKGSSPRPITGKG